MIFTYSLQSNVKYYVDSVPDGLGRPDQSFKKIDVAIKCSPGYCICLKRNKEKEWSGTRSHSWELLNMEIGTNLGQAFAFMILLLTSIFYLTEIIYHMWTSHWIQLSLNAHWNLSHKDSQCSRLWKNWTFISKSATH